MAESTNVNVHDVVGSEFCISSEDGEKVYTIVEDALKSNVKVSLSFVGVEDITSAFLNVAIGQLYGKFDEDHVRTYLSISDLARQDVSLLRRVVERAKEYFRHPDPFDAAVQEALGGANED